MTLTPAQLALRRTGIGASEIGAVAGLDPWRSPVDVYLRKVDEAASPTSGPQAWGNILEPIIGEYYAFQNAVTLVGSDTRRHPTVTWALATPDYLVPPERYGLEIKVRGRSDRWDGVPPLEVQAQAQWSMFVVGYDRWDVAALLGGTEYRQYRVDRDDAFITQLTEAGERFWTQHVVPRVPPPARTTEDAKALYPRVLAKNYARATEDEEDDLALYGKLRDADRLLGKQLDEVKARLMDGIKDQAGLIGTAGSVSWSQVRAGVDWEAWARSLGASDKDQEQYRKAPFRRFTFQPTKEPRS